MSLNALGLQNAMVSHAQTTGYFDVVNTHDVDSSPGNGIHAQITFDRAQPVRSSGLISTSALVTFAMRLMYPLTAQPRDDAEMYLLQAFDALMTIYTGDFSLGDLVRDIDLLGQFSDGLSALAGYAQYDDGWYRVIDITIPLVVDDVWTQTS